MAAQIIREWTGIQQFPLATQTKLHELLGKLKQENVSTLTILVMGKGGVGKSSTVNSIIGERAVAVSAFQGSSIPVVLVENSGRCNKNDDDEKILPDGTTWIPNLLKTIADTVSKGSKAILVNKELIEGPNPNEKGKLLIPLILAVEYLFVVKLIQRWIKDDIAKENRPTWD